MRTLDRGKIWPLAVGAIVATAWVALAVWERSPYGRFLDHGGWLGAGAAGSLCRTTPSGLLVPPAALYVGGWLLMSIAMMLPTALPLVALFARMTESRRNRGALLALLILGYVSIWTGFGLLAQALDSALHALVAGDRFLAFNGWMIGAAVFAIAGAFQFSRLKTLCLDRCRTPFSFIGSHWRGLAARPPVVHARRAPRPVLRRLLLGDHAPDVRRRDGQRRLDAGDRRHHGDREERELGSPSQRAARTCPAIDLRRDCRAASVTRIRRGPAQPRFSDRRR